MSSFEKWLKIYTLINNNLSNSHEIKCPKCKTTSIDIQYVGDPSARIGYVDVWCNNCLQGIHLSRVLIPEQTQIIPFDKIENVGKRIPNFEKIYP